MMPSNAWTSDEAMKSSFLRPRSAILVIGASFRNNTELRSVMQEHPINQLGGTHGWYSE